MKTLYLFNFKNITNIAGYTIASVFIYFILLTVKVRYTSARLVAKFIKYRLLAKFPVYRVIAYILRRLNRQIRKKRLVGYKILLSGRFTRRGRSKYIWRRKRRVTSNSVNCKIDYILELVILLNSICGIKI